ncbi:hypothetical protein DUI87_30528 [Hirundo rustica rustica]|uniref:Reverse transcriptase domain-containing protein n=1 Tax=Hirundo rustica rustica TaxID=333673 RepID=A0A3M0IX04_HIRRU|nr:hypothetical protein DUI87_30528 [Hirundo rustica rustica]
MPCRFQLLFEKHAVLTENALSPNLLCSEYSPYACDAHTRTRTTFQVSTGPQKLQHGRIGSCSLAKSLGHRFVSHQEYKNYPTIFGEQLAKDLESWEPPPGEGQLLEYVDELLIATRTQETCVDWTVSLLNFLGLQGYRVSQKKTQMVRQAIIYLGYEVSAGQRTLGQDHKDARP